MKRWIRLWEMFGWLSVVAIPAEAYVSGDSVSRDQWLLRAIVVVMGDQRSSDRNAAQVATSRIDLHRVLTPRDEVAAVIADFSSIPPNRVSRP